jgi:putative peptidoglycan lipid II flippase
VFIAGILELLLVMGDAGRAQVLARFKWPRLDQDVRKFFRALGPATVGSAGVQLAMFADTIIASFLAAGAISALYYADRINQLPIGVIGIAIGTVLLPEMSRRLAAGDEAGARHAQNRAIELTLLLTIPCLVAFLLIPDLIMRALFLRGKFTADDALAAGATLAAYAIGLIPYVLIRSMTAPFFARGDTATPVKASLIAVAINILIKIALMGPLAQVGLAIATAIGAWVNLGLVTWFASRAGIAVVDGRLKRSMLLLTAIGCVFGIALFLSQRIVTALYRDMPAFRDEATLATLAVIGGILYGALVLLLLGRNWFRAFRGDRQPAATLPKPD